MHNNYVDHDPLCFSPEVVKSEPYGEKADVWALGCVLYQMATLQPPFYSSNMLSLANKVQYQYTLLLLCPNSLKHYVTLSSTQSRPDIVQVSSSISELLMRAMDRFHTSYNALERRAQRDRKRVHQYFLERNQANVPSAPTQVRISGGRSLKSSNCEMVHMALTCQRYTLDLASAEIQSVTSCMFGLLFVGSVSAALCVSQSRVRQIDDPSNRLLLQLHKVLFITQLPPAPHHDSKRHLVERFKKSLFNVHSDPYNLKVELSKVFIEELLEENGYYKSTR
uniref:Protein kinase domain-containing protein n=1 Tax=Periophthalmus magnuspinnatus TaxID=409849 RepID=A0A3B4B4W0_9GOBI